MHSKYGKLLAKIAVSSFFMISLCSCFSYRLNYSAEVEIKGFASTQGQDAKQNIEKSTTTFNFVYGETYSTGYFPLFCGLTFLYYGGACWFYLALPYASDQAEFEEHSNRELMALMGKYEYSVKEYNIRRQRRQREIPYYLLLSSDGVLVSQGVAPIKKPFSAEKMQRALQNLPMESSKDETAASTDLVGDDRIRHFFLDFSSGSGINGMSVQGQSIGWYPSSKPRLFRPRFNLDYVKGNSEIHLDEGRHYRLYQSLLHLDFALELCPKGNGKFVQCPFIPSIGIAKRDLGGIIQLPSGSDRYGGRTSAATLGGVGHIEFAAIVYNILRISAKFTHFFPLEALETRDTFPSDASESNRKISTKALDRIHEKESNFAYFSVGLVY